MLVKKAEYLISATCKSNFPKHNLPEFLFLGRSNVGKSSFINALTNRKKLAYTSGKPGKTITINYYQIDEKMMFVDVPGYGYASKLKTDRVRFGKMIEDLLDNNQNLKLIFLIVDIRHEPSEDDLLMYNYLRYFELPIVIVATKADKIGSTLIQRHLKIIKTSFKLSNDDLVVPISSVTKLGFDEIDNLILSTLDK